MASEVLREDGSTQHVYTHLPHRATTGDDVHLRSTHKKNLATYHGRSDLIRKKKKDSDKASTSTDDPPPATILRYQDSIVTEVLAPMTACRATTNVPNISKNVSNSKSFSTNKPPMDLIKPNVSKVKPKALQRRDADDVNPRSMLPVSSHINTPELDRSLLPLGSVSLDSLCTAIADTIKIPNV